MTTGFVVGSTARINCDVIPVGARLQHVILRGYLTNENSPKVMVVDAAKLVGRIRISTRLELHFYGSTADPRSPTIGRGLRLLVFFRIQAARFMTGGGHRCAFFEGHHREHPHGPILLNSIFSELVLVISG